MRATLLNCSLKPSDEQSNTQLLADHVVSRLETKGVVVDPFRLSEIPLPYGVQTNLGSRDGWPSVHETIMAASPSPGQSWTYWNRGPGPGPQYADTDEGHEWSINTGLTMADNLYATAEALRANPIPRPDR